MNCCVFYVKTNFGRESMKKESKNLNTLSLSLFALQEEREHFFRSLSHFLTSLCFLFLGGRKGSEGDDS